MIFDWIIFISGTANLIFWFLKLSFWARATVNKDRAYIHQNGTKASMRKSSIGILLLIALSAAGYYRAEFKGLWIAVFSMLVILFIIMFISYILTSKNNLNEMEEYSKSIPYSEKNILSGISKRRKASCLPACLLLLWILSWSDLY